MKIGIVGAGNIAGAVGLLWARAGHEIRFGTRHPETLTALVQAAGPNASAGTALEAARFGEIVFCSTPYGAWPEIAASLGPAMSGKIVIDSANPYPERDGDFARQALAAGNGAGVPVARLLPGTRFVRGFNSVNFRTLETEAHRAGDRIGIPLASDDSGAMLTVADLVHDAGFAPVIVGPLLRARDFDPGSPVYNTGMSGPDLARALGVGFAP
jgi:predicted dinucleotide-binding enzyme